MDVQTIVNLARTLSYSDNTQVTDTNATLFANLVYKDIRNMIMANVNEHYGADYFTSPLVYMQSEYDIPTIVGNQHGADHIIEVTVDYVPNGVSSPRKATLVSLVDMDMTPDQLAIAQPFDTPIFEIFDTSIFLYPSPFTNNFTFNVSTPTIFPNVGDTYSNNGIGFTVLSTNNILNTVNCSIYSGNGLPSNTGTLTKVNGSGDTTLTFTSYLSNSGSVTIYAATIEPDLVLNTSTTQIKGIPEYYQKTIATGMVAYMFQMRGELELANPWKEQYQQELNDMETYLQRRYASPVPRAYTTYPNLQGSATGNNGYNPLSIAG